LLSEGIAANSKLSRLLTVGNRASLMRRDHPLLPVDQFELGQAQQITRVVDAFGGALLGKLVVFAQEARQPEWD
jgi:hypothetical protein